MDQVEALAQIGTEVYVPAFVKAAEDLGMKITDEDTLRDALSIAGALENMQSTESSNTIKQAKEDLLKAAGVEETPAAAPQYGELPNKLKEALATLIA